MFIHFGISTFIDDECPGGETSPAAFNPTHLDVDQWICVARDAGMKYAVLTTKHCSGHCLWLSRLTDFDVQSSPVKIDVVGEFVTACHKYGLEPGFYYLLGWDAHTQPFLTPEQYEEYCRGQLTELLTWYGPIRQVFLDIPFDTGPDVKGVLARLYVHIKSLQPDCLVLPNQAFTDGSRVTSEKPTWRHQDLKLDPVPIWPRDLMNGERTLPPAGGHNPRIVFEDREYYLPMEVCDTLTENWFWTTRDKLRPAAGLYRLYKACRDRGANLLLDVGPDRTGRIPGAYVQRLIELKALIDNPSRVPVSLCQGRPATASNVYHGDMNWAPAKAVDGDVTTRWATDDELRSAWLEVDLGGPAKFNAAYLREGWDRTRAFEIQIPVDAGGWRSVFRGERIGGAGVTVRFDAVTADRVRLNILEATVGPTIWDFEIYRE
jgi:alpha-L-fucosidase